jgi:hypothetical protein
MTGFSFAFFFLTIKCMRKINSFYPYLAYFLFFLFYCNKTKIEELTDLEELKQQGLQLLRNDCRPIGMANNFQRRMCLFTIHHWMYLYCSPKRHRKGCGYDEPILKNIMAKNPGLKLLPELITKIATEWLFDG